MLQTVDTSLQHFQILTHGRNTPHSSIPSELVTTLAAIGPASLSRPTVPSPIRFFFTMDPENRTMTKQNLLATLCLVGAAFALSPVSQASAEIKFGVMANRGELAAQNEWAPFVEYLSGKVGQPVTLVVFPIEKTYEMVESKAVDFVFTNPVQSAGIVKKYGGKTIASRETGEGKEFGGVIIASKKSGVTKSEDLRGKKIMAFSPTSAGAYVFQRYHLFKKGIDVTKDLAEMKYAKKQDDIVLATRAGLVDAGFVRTGLLESMVKDGKVKLEDLTIVDPVKHDGFNYLASTALYPDWYVLSLAHTAPDVASAVAKAAHDLKASDPAAEKAKVKGLGAPVPIEGMISLLEELKLEPFDK